MATQNKKNSNKKISNKKKNNAENFGLEDIIAQNSNAEKTFESLLVRSYDMEEELMKCQTAADQGYSVATKKYEEISINLLKAEHKLKKAEEDQNQLARIQATTLISKQEKEIQNIRDYIGEIRKNIDVLHERQKEFSIAVFGRKMSGKSTLMEILTHGNGSTIGKSVPRTASDIRSYYWKGLKITDLPSLDFFQDSEANKIGMDAAKSADVVLFLMTNETPQAEEAQCLAQLKNLGKPVLTIINVQKDLNFKKPNLALKELQKTFNDDETDKVVDQLKELLKGYNHDWKDFKHVVTHLSAAYYAQFAGSYADEIFQASRFSEVEEFILEKIKADGEFLRTKNFIDSIAVPMNEIILKLFEHSGFSLQESKVWRDKYREIAEWRKNFWENAQIKIQKLYSELQQNLKYEIPHFAQVNYNNENVKEEWNKYISQFGYVERYQELLKEISKDCDEQYKKFSVEFTKELKLAFNGRTQTDIKLEETTPWEQYAAIILPNLLMLVPGIGWTARVTIFVASSFFSSLFENKEEKVRKAVASLQQQLEESSLDTLAKVNNQARDILNKQILGNVDEFTDTLIGYSYMLAQLGEFQSQMAERLLGEYNDLNETLFYEAVKYKKAGSIADMRNTMRIPGEISAVLMEKPTVNDDAVTELLGEKFLTIKLLDSWNDIMRQILGCDFDLNSYPISAKVDGKTYSVTPREEITVTEFKLAQQISPYPIILQ